MPRIRSGCGEIEQVVVALQVTRPIAEPLAAKVRLLQSVLLDHRAHRAVEQDNPASEGGGQGIQALFPVHGG